MRTGARKRGTGAHRKERGSRGGAAGLETHTGDWKDHRRGLETHRRGTGDSQGGLGHTGGMRVERLREFRFGPHAQTWTKLTNVDQVDKRGPSCGNARLSKLQQVTNSNRREQHTKR